MECATCRHESATPFKFCPECGAPAHSPKSQRERRKVVTVLFCDVTGSTALGERLDSEALRGLLARYFEQMKQIVERHGGVVEKFIGDAVMAVFGVPAMHEDDALRAVQAAVAMRDAFPRLGIEGRIGVMTGEVVTGTTERLATGDPVNVAARLEQAARPGEILIGAETLRFVQDVADVRPIEPLVLKGKAEAVEAYRVLALRSGAAAIRQAPLVGRDKEQRLLGEAFATVVSDRVCRLFTLTGEAGVGKSRLVSEFLAGIDATVVGGHCLGYGEGITYWPVLEVLRELRTRPPEYAAAAAVGSLLGESDASTAPDEIAWAVRRTLECGAAQNPLVVVFDDIHLGAPVLLDLIAHVADKSSGAAILLLCLARPELLHDRPEWPVALHLEPLDEAETDALLADLGAAPTARAQLAQAAAGNPLFAEELVAWAREGGLESGSLPTTLNALLGARLDQLDVQARDALERAAVEGELFHQGAVIELSDEDSRSSVADALEKLKNDDLLHPAVAKFPGETALRFKHILLRDAVYQTTAKKLRATLHEQFAYWLERVDSERATDYEEIVGYHLEQACRYRLELGLAENVDLTVAARSRLTSAGRRALLRSDFTAAANLLERAASLVPTGEVDRALELDLMMVLPQIGRATEVIERARSLADGAAASGDRIGELYWRIAEALRRFTRDAQAGDDALRALVDQALPLFEASGDDFALYLVHEGRGWIAHGRGHHDAALEACEQMHAHVWRAGVGHHFAASILSNLALQRYHGSTPVPEILAWLDEQESRGLRNVGTRQVRAHSLAMLGRLDEARAILSELRAEFVERGATRRIASVDWSSVDVELLGGDPVAAADFGREACRLLEEAGALGQLSTAAGKLGQALYDLNRLDEADAEAMRAAELSASDDVITQMLWRQVRAKVLARRGEHVDAERLAAEAVELAESTDSLMGQGNAYSDLAEVLALASKNEQAYAALERGINCHTRKGDLVSAGRAEARLAELRALSMR